MTFRLQIVIGMIAILALLMIANMVRKEKIDLRYALSWMCLTVIILVLDIFPQIVFVIADLMGISIPSNMVFFVGFILLVVMVYSVTVVVSRLSAKTKRLTQELALLREELERMKD